MPSGVLFPWIVIVLGKLENEKSNCWKPRAMLSKGMTSQKLINVIIVLLSILINETGIYPIVKSEIIRALRLRHNYFLFSYEIYLCGKEF